MSSTLDSEAKVSVQVFQGIHWGGSAISAFFVAFRIYVRIKSFKRLYLDDYLVILAWLMLLGNAIIWNFAKKGLYTLLNVNAGLEPFPPDFAQQVVQYLQLTSGVQVMFFTSLWFIKFSFLVFFRRLGQNVRWQNQIWWIVTGFVAAGYPVAIGTVQWKCLLSSYAYIASECPQPRSIAFERAVIIVNCVIDILTDLSIMIVPFHVLWKVQIRKRQKLGLAGVFSITVFIIVIAIVRIAFLLHAACHSQDGSWLFSWSTVEQTVALIVASLAAVRALFTRGKDPQHPPKRYPDAGKTRLGNKRSEAIIGLREISPKQTISPAGRLSPQSSCSSSQDLDALEQQSMAQKENRATRQMSPKDAV